MQQIVNCPHCLFPFVYNSDCSMCGLLAPIVDKRGYAYCYACWGDSMSPFWENKPDLCLNCFKLIPYGEMYA